MDNEIKVGSWEECETRVRALEANHTALQPLLFRGHADANWPLASTLERRTEKVVLALQYYGIISRLKATVESLTGLNFDLPKMEELTERFKDYDFGVAWPAYSYIAHVRHLGFPSPLLDWTRSFYVATYFAFSSAQENDVAIFAFSDMPNNMKLTSGDKSQILRLGPNVKTHERHYRQQSEYTICRKFESSKGWMFSKYQEVLDEKKPNQDVIYKFVIPASERLKVLRHLDKFNLNAFSLFSSHESLMETLAFREIDSRFPT